MSETKIKVPDGMLTAARKISGKINNYSETVTAAILEAALLWQRENVQRPTDYEFGDMVNACRQSVGIEAWENSTEWMRAGILCHEWISRMYDAPEPEATDDLSPIKDLIPPMNGFPIANPAHVLMEAYRRGQKASLK